MKDKKLFITIVSIFTIISFIIGVSYAYFSANIIGNDTASNHNQTTGTLQLTYNGTSFLSMPNASPGDTTSTTFTVKNTGNLPVDNYEIYFSKLKNTFINEEVVYTLTCTSSDTNNCQGKEQSPIPPTESLALTQNSIEPNTTHTYTLEVTFLDKVINQNYNQGKELKFTMTINELEELPPPTLIARQAYDSTELFWEHRSNITEVTFENSINIPNGVTSWDTSANQDESVIAYIIDDGLGTNTYKLYIQSNGILNANPNSSNLFRDFTKLKTINNLSNFNTSSVTTMYAMFYGCSSLSSLDLSSFNTSRVTSMPYMFYGCSSLSSLDLNSLNTNSVTSMSGMFYGCSGLTSIDLSNFDTSNVTDMSQMFFGCSSLSSLDLSSLNTNSVANMSWMFRNCSSLTSLDISSFDTSKVTNMLQMFYGCSGLSSLDLSNFNTSNVITMSLMFYGCSGLTSLNLSNFTTSRVTSMSLMFHGCSGLTSVDLSSFNTSSVISMNSMFEGCSSLTSVELSNFNTSNVTNMSSMFRNCSSLTNLDIRNATFTSVTSYSYMFTNITSGINIIVKDVDAQTFINARLSEASKTGNVTIYVP